MQGEGKNIQGQVSVWPLPPFLNLERPSLPLWVTECVCVCLRGCGCGCGWVSVYVCQARRKNCTHTREQVDRMGLGLSSRWKAKHKNVADKNYPLPSPYNYWAKIRLKKTLRLSVISGKVTLKKPYEGLLKIRQGGGGGGEKGF